MKRHSIIWPAIFAVFLFNACKLGKEYTRPELDLPTTIDGETTDSLNVAAIQWWDIYTDTVLQNLIQKTLTHNKDLLMAAAPTGCSSPGRVTRPTPAPPSICTPAPSVLRTAA